MRKRSRSFWKLVNEEPLNRDRLSTDARSLRRMFGRYFLRPYAGTVFLAVFLGAISGSLTPFFYAAAGRYVADDIVQVHLLAREHERTEPLDPTRPEEERRFVLGASGGGSGAWTERQDARPGRTIAEKMEMIAWLAVVLIAVTLLDHIVAYIGWERRIHVGQKAKFEMRRRLYEKLHALPMRYHDRNSTGSLMTNLFSDVGQSQEMAMQLAQHVPKHLLTMGVGLAILFSIDARLTLLVLLALPAYSVCYRWFRGRLRVMHSNLREREGMLNAQIANRLTNFYLVKSFVRETFEAIDFLRSGRRILRNSVSVGLLSTLFSVCCGIISGVCMAAVLWIGALKVRDGAMTLGTLLLFYGSAGFLFRPVAFLTAQAGMYHRLSAIARKIMRIIDEPVELTDPETPVERLKEAPEVRFENVTLNYGGGRQPALRDVSFTLPAGRSLCVMGPSGSGKTTLANLACRIYDPTEGAVRLDDADLREFRITDVREMIGFVSQEPVIFDGTIADNIRYGSERAGMDDMVSAAQSAQIHDYIIGLPDRYETLTRERGLTLSGGQKQRVNLARTLLYDPKLLVLDDCTSALDAETEARLVRGFETALEGRTAILVSHRISIALNCDYVCMLDEGRIVEFGPPQELLENDGPFAELHDQQTTEAAADRPRIAAMAGAPA